MTSPAIYRLTTLLSWLPLPKMAAAEAVPVMIGKYCIECHDADAKKGGLNLEAVLKDDVAQHGDTWEKVVRRLATRQMPPAKTKLRPTELELEAVTAALGSTLDAAAKAKPRPGRTETVRRLNRTEYQNAIRDLLAVEIDAAALLPADESSHGFDNVTVGTLSPTLLDRYVTAAQKISRLATGGELRVPGGETIRIRPDITQEDRVEGLPFGTRGGALIPYNFPRDGEYEITIRLTRDRNDNIEGRGGHYTLLVLLDREEVESFTVTVPVQEGGHDDVDKHLTFRLPVKAGPRRLGVTFLKESSSLLEYKRQPYEARFNFHRHPRTAPAVFQISITGPHGTSIAGDTPSRQRIFIARPASVKEEEACTEKVLSSLLRRAWRRPVTAEDVARFLPFFRESKQDGFDAGIEAALSAVLVSREFLFRVEKEPQDLPANAAYRITDIELASRLSFFLWSSIPDEELLAAAERGELSRPDVLAAQTRRMLADERAQSLVTNFAAQWLHLRNLDSITPDGRLFPDFDDNLRQAMRRETELLFNDIVREDRSVLELLQPDHVWLNERLAKHYGIPHIHGAHFRNVAAGADTETARGGLLRNASMLTVTSYATRTSPVIRGKWILENLIGTPPPPPAPNVPALDGSVVSERLPIRQRLAAHRDKAACASCHEFIDPPGFALEHYDALGRWRLLEAGQPVDATGGLPDGSTFTGVTGLEAGLMARPEVFARTMTEKLLTFALGRGVEPYDGPAIREILRTAKAGNYRLSSIIAGVVNSVPFQQRQKL
jgi:hypothetical protein